MARAYGVDAAREVASERLADGHNVLFFHASNHVSTIDDMIEAIEEEGWSLDKMVCTEEDWYGLFRSA